MHANTMPEVQFMPVHMGVDQAYFQGLPGMPMGDSIDMQHDHFMMGDEHRPEIFGEPHEVAA